MKYEFKLVGVTKGNRQGYINYINKEKDACLMYRLSPTKNEPNRVKVLAWVPGKKVVEIGFLPKNIANEIAPLMRKGFHIWTYGYKILTNGERWGVKVEMQPYKPRVYKKACKSA